MCVFPSSPSARRVERPLVCPRQRSGLRIAQDRFPAGARARHHLILPNPPSDVHNTTTPAWCLAARVPQRPGWPLRSAVIAGQSRQEERVGGLAMPRAWRTADCH
ncbi:uncharacterized protein TRAVEDRAFT_58570, partial [Trametes versicolor FP-101664 SS1]|uniref:uncharacterized protein n=1 Tax=Trametes versicolor (strain FP-101664) TaxID=717944 RepID=UPI0004622A82